MGETQGCLVLILGAIIIFVVAIPISLGIGWMIQATLPSLANRTWFRDVLIVVSITLAVRPSLWIIDRTIAS